MTRVVSPLVVVVGFVFGVVGGAYHTSVAQGPWPEQPGSGECLTSYYHYRSDQITDAEGEARSLPNNGRYRSHRLQLLCQVGVAKRWTAVLKFPYLYHRYTDNRIQLETGDLDDQEVGLRFLMTNQQTPVSVEVRAGLPWGYSANQSPRIGHDQYYLQGMLAGGTSVGPSASGWVGLAGGVKHFMGGAGTQLPYQITSGWHITPSGMVYLQGRGELNLAGGSVSTGNPRNPQVQTGRSVLQGAFSAVYAVTGRMSLQVEYYRDLWGQRSGMGQGWAFSVWVQWN